MYKPDDRQISTLIDAVADAHVFSADQRFQSTFRRSNSCAHNAIAFAGGVLQIAAALDRHMAA